MAVCEIWDVRGRLDHPLEYVKNPDKTAVPEYTENELQSLSDVMSYATNSEKTEKKFYVRGINCDPVSARTEMLMAKAQWNDESRIICYHGFQSFRPGETTPEKAHEIGVRLAERMWGARFQVIVATHLNTECLHNHFVINSVSFMDGQHYHDNRGNLRLLREISDELCREHGLSVIEKPEGWKKQYALYQAEKAGLPTRDSVARQAVDEAIAGSFTMRDFIGLMTQMGYQVDCSPGHKYWTIKGKGWKRAKRLYRLGEDYTNDSIRERIGRNSYAVRFSYKGQSDKPYPVFRLKQGSLAKARKIGGLRGLYLHYCFRLGILPKAGKQNYARLHYLLKEDLLKMDAISRETRLLCRNGIETDEQLQEFKASLEKEMQELERERKEICSKSRGNPGRAGESGLERRKEISERLGIIRKELRLCKGIEQRSGSLREKLAVIREDERKEREQNEHGRRSGRPGRQNDTGRSRGGC